MTARPYRFTIILAALTAALAPTYLVRWHIGFYPTTLLEIFILLTAATFAVETVRQRTRPQWMLPITIPVALFLVAGAIAGLVAPSRLSGLGLFRAFIVEPILFGFVLINVVTTPARAKLVLAGLGIAGLAVGLPNAVVVLEALRAHTYDVTQSPPVVIYTSPNDAPLFLGPLIGMAGSLFLHSLDLRTRVLSLVFLLGAVASALLSFSRGGYLMLAAVAVVLALSHRWRIWLLAGMAVVALVLIFATPIGSRIALQFQDVAGNTILGPRGRIFLWSRGLEVIRDQPLTGAGLSGFYPHNIVLNFWVATGILGLVAFAWLMYATLRVSWHGWRRGVGEWRALEFGVFVALVAVLAHGLVDVPYFKNDLSLAFWTILGIGWAGARFHFQSASEPAAATSVRGRAGARA